MECRWQSFLDILPPRLRDTVDRQGRDSLLELRLRRGQVPELCLLSGSRFLGEPTTQQDLTHCVNMASRYSPWVASTTAMGYLTAPGGHRLGVCGAVSIQGGAVTGFSRVDSLCIRVCRDIAAGAGKLKNLSGSTLILGAPGWGKTTLLRDLCRILSEDSTVCVVDERCEIFPEGFRRGRRMDVLSGCNKHTGMHMVLRSMTPAYIAVDEITGQADTAALLDCVGCGVKLLATAHAGSLSEFQERASNRELLARGVFRQVLMLGADRQFHLEAPDVCQYAS